MRLDHLSYAAGPEGLGATAQHLGAKLGASFIDGGLHPRFGTRNFVLPLDNGTFLQVVGRLDHPAADKEPFGQAVTRCTEAGGGWMGWAIRVPDIAVIEERLGRTSVPGSRFRPDGVPLEWRQIGVRDMLENPLNPYFLQWQSEPELHPASMPMLQHGQPIRISAIEVAGDPAILERTVQVLDGIELRWVEAPEDVTGIISVFFDTEHGEVQLD